MKKYFTKLSAVLLMAGIGSASYAKTVDQNTAGAIGSNYLISVGAPGVKSASDLSLAYTATTDVNGNTVTDYYVFNVTGSKGFVMVSADDIVIPILAYSNESSFDINSISPEAKYWIDIYKKQITAVITNNAAAKASTTQRWNELKTNNGDARTRYTSTGVTPLLSTDWNQNPFYNDLCPSTSTTGGLSVTGCVATAMAQIMKFWSWPTVGTGSHTYYDPYSASEGSGCNLTLTANFSATAYQWSSMPDYIFGDNTPIEQLMLQAGISVDMSYSANGSGAYVLSWETEGINCAQYALPTYFHYKPSLQGIPRSGEAQGYSDPTIDSIAETTWITMLQTELNAGRPMLYDGAGADGGHCWVLDGWEVTGNMFHFNWGWGGYDNGYFTVDNLDPSNLGGANLDMDQGVIMGIEPDSFPNTPGNIEVLAPLNANVSSPMPYNTPFAITTKILNSGTTSYSGNFCAQVYDSSNTLIGTIATITGETIAAGDSSALLTFSTSGMNAMVPFLYSIRVLYEPTGSSTWTPVANNGSFINYTMMGIDNDTDIVLYDSLHIGSHTFITGSPMSITTIIGEQQIPNFNGTTEGLSTFHGTVQAVLISIADGTQYTVQQYTSQTIDTMGSGYHYTFSNSAMSVPPGEYALEVQHQYNGAGSYYVTSSDYYTNPVLIHVISSTSAPALASGENVYVYPNPANNVININLQGVTATEIRVMDIQGSTISTIKPANQSMISVPVANLAAGIYFVHVQTETGAVTKKVVIAR